MFSLIRPFVERCRNYLIRPLQDDARDRYCAPDAASQLQLKFHYEALMREGAPLPKFHTTGFKVYSQTDEDGLLWFLFSIIGTTNKHCVEISAGNARECNTTNLIVNHGWAGLLVDGDEQNVRDGKGWLAKHPATYVDPPIFIKAWVTRFNINSILQTHGYTGPIDLLSIDVDGMDYWLWDAITVCEPRVVIIEYQAHLGPERSWTVPYSDDFVAQFLLTEKGPLPSYSGASLAAICKVAERKGYRLVGVNRCCFNAFFVKRELAAELLPAISPRECFHHPRALWSIRERFRDVEHRSWQEV